MPKIRYRFNPDTLNYEKVQLSLWDRLKKVLWIVVTGIVFAGLTMLISYTLFDSPKELMLKRENDELKRQFKGLNDELGRMEAVIGDIERRDDNIYRAIFEAEPIPTAIRQAGVGGVNRYQHLEGTSISDLLIETTYRLDKIAKRLYIQSKSFDEIAEMVKTKEDLMAAIPAIMPMSDKDLNRMASGFGYRIDPIYKTKKFHAGMDFSAPVGSPIHVTGNGRVVKAQSDRGYGMHVIVDHGYGYRTLYAHMSKILVRPGQLVNRGDLIGLVGNTGKSVGAHLHYEVHKDGQAVNPINFYFNDLNPEEYDRMIELSSQANQALD